jgi:hypothetical protein
MRNDLKKALDAVRTKRGMEPFAVRFADKPLDGPPQIEKPEYATRVVKPGKRYRPSKGRRRSEKDNARSAAWIEKKRAETRDIHPSELQAPQRAVRDDSTVADEQTNPQSHASRQSSTEGLGYTGDSFYLPLPTPLPYKPSAEPERILTRQEATAFRYPIRISWGVAQYKPGPMGDWITCRDPEAIPSPVIKPRPVAQLFERQQPTALSRPAGACPDNHTNRPCPDGAPRCTGGCQ